jgi:hypothetical protein
MTIPGGRKFFLVIGCGVACTVLVWFAKITDGTFATIILGTVAPYIAGNVWQHRKGQSDAGG